jgi:hypothetical protein
VEDEDATPTNGFGSNEGCSLLLNKNFFSFVYKKAKASRRNMDGYSLNFLRSFVRKKRTVFRR